MAWKKTVGGKWWGYQQQIEPGSYSDDTQLALAVARCMAEDGTFIPEKFAYEELPLWLQYERGGGKSVKTAARKLIGKRADWQCNFYKQGDLDYKTAGANGAAMRNLPIALVNVNDEEALIRESFLNAIITHGHPRAIVGSILFALIVNYVLLSSNNISGVTLIGYLENSLAKIGPTIAKDARLMQWLRYREEENKAEIPFRKLFNQSRQETIHFLQNIDLLSKHESTEYYVFVGAFDATTKGSGIATVCAAIYMFLKYIDQPEQGLFAAVNMLGSDTDTIGVFLGALFGAYYGTQAIPSHLLARVQNSDYLRKIAGRLHTIATLRKKESYSATYAVDRRDAYFKILSWGIGFHDMFREQPDPGAVVFHPTLGQREVTASDIQPVMREGYIARLVSIKFTSGQTCVFHSRVENNEKVSESLAQEITKALL